MMDFFKKTKKFFKILFGIFSISFLLYALIIGSIKNGEEEKLFSQDGIIANAQIVEIFNDSHRVKTHKIYYEYTYDSKPYKHSDYVSKKYINQRIVGENIEIIFSKSRPEVSRINHDFKKENIRGSLIDLGGVLLFIVTLAFITFLWRLLKAKFFRNEK